MARLCYATEPQLRELIRQSGLPENAPPANAFRMFAQAPAVGAATLRLVFALLTETDLDPKLRELVILRAAQHSPSCEICFSPRDVVELLLLIGYFRMICVIMTTLEVEVESPFGAKVLASLRDSAPVQPGQMH